MPEHMKLQLGIILYMTTELWVLLVSLNCYNVTIENNTVFNSAGSGFMFSRNMYNSIDRANIVYNECKCAFMSLSHDNERYYKRVNNCNNGIYISTNHLPI